MSNWSNLAKVVYKRTYARKDNGTLENWADTVERVIAGNVQGHNVTAEEIERLRYYLMNRKAGPAGRGWWYSGAPSHKKLGGVALNNCWFVAGDEWNNFVLAQDLLMLGGGVGMSVEHRFVSKLPKLKKDVNIVSRDTKDADFIVPDSREGWNELTRRVLESFFSTGKSFSYSTVCIRPAGEPIKGFGGVSSGPKPLITYVDKLLGLLKSREGRHLRPVDAADILCSIGEMVVSGNVRRSAIIILGDPWDKEYLKCKRWDLGNIPKQRAMANFSVVVDDVEDLHPLFWKTYEQGEPFGLVNRKNIQKFARMGENKPDTAIGVSPCLTGDTLVMTVFGEKTIKELADSNANFEVYSYDEEKKEVVTKNAIAFKTKEDAQIMLLKTKSGKEIKLTPDHRVLTDKGWIQAKDLTKEHKLYKIS